jgi:biotin transport system permease protein
MLSLYRPGSGWIYRASAGAKLGAIMAVVLGVSFLPSNLWTLGVMVALPCLCYTLSGLGWRELGHQLFVLRWVTVIALAVQLLFVPFDLAITNTCRVVTAILIANVLVLTTRLETLLDSAERGLRPVARLGVSPERVALALALAITTIPVLTRISRDVREAQRARGLGASLTRFTVPFLVGALKHADELGEALTARGIE